jgi:hypothetical protein
MRSGTPWSSARVLSGILTGIGPASVRHLSGIYDEGLMGSTRKQRDHRTLPFETANDRDVIIEQCSIQENAVTNLVFDL